MSNKTLGEKLGPLLYKADEKIQNVKNQTSEMITEEQMKDILDGIYSRVLKGIPNVEKPIDVLVDDYMSKNKSVEAAAKSMIKHQLIKCTTSGFLSNIGGLITLPVAIPANITSVLYVQMRMIAALAKMGGYDTNSDQVQTLVYACLTGQSIGTVFKQFGIKVGEKFAIKGIEKIAGATLVKINKFVGFRLITKFGEKGLINLGKMVPAVGGIIGGGFDFATTKVIANNAYKAFILKNFED